MKDFKKVFFTIILLVTTFVFSLNLFAAAGVAKKGDLFVPSSINGNTAGKAFRSAAVTISALDNSGNYTYYGADIGIYKKTDKGSNWIKIYTKRITTPALTIKVNDFGNIAKYRYNSVYAIYYRVLYQTTDSADTIITGPWKQVEGSYFKVIPPSTLQDTGSTTQATK